MREMGQIEYDGLVKVSRADAVRNIIDACSLPVRLKPKLFEGIHKLIKDWRYREESKFK